MTAKAQWFIACAVVAIAIGVAGYAIGATAVEWTEMTLCDGQAAKCTFGQLSHAGNKMRDPEACLVVGTALSVDPVHSDSAPDYMAIVRLKIEQRLAGAACGDTLQFVTDNTFVPCPDQSELLCMAESTSRPWVLIGDRIIVMAAPHVGSRKVAEHLREMYIGFLRDPASIAITDSTAVYAEISRTFDGQAYVRDALVSPVSPYAYLMVTRAPMLTVGAVVRACNSDSRQGVSR